MKSPKNLLNHGSLIDFDEFVAKQKEFELEKPSKSQALMTEFQKWLIFNRGKVDIATAVAKSLTQFAIHKTPFALVEGGLETVRSLILDKTYYSNDFFHESNGWRLLGYDGIQFQGIFSNVLKKFPSKGLKFEYDRDQFSRLFELPIGQIGVITSAHLPDQIFYPYEKIGLEEVVEFLVVEKLKDLGTNVISLEFSKAKNDGSTIMTLLPEIIFPKDSPKAKTYTDYINKCLDLGINRSIMFHGPPGTGKTTLCQTIVHNLNFRTLKFRYTPDYDFSLFAFVVRKFKIEAVMIDDFDQCDSRDELLEFLEMLKKEVKVVIGLANSLKEFHPALLRPGRFDEIVVIDCLEPHIVKEILGPKLSRSYFSKVKKWPVAYLNEFVTRSKLLSAQELTSSFQELSKRVENNLKEHS